MPAYLWHTVTAAPTSSSLSTSAAARPGTHHGSAPYVLPRSTSSTNPGHHTRRCQTSEAAMWWKLNGQLAPRVGHAEANITSG
jgi:hypothetical protein